MEGDESLPLPPLSATTSSFSVVARSFLSIGPVAAKSQKKQHGESKKMAENELT
jgi:hypothetical protein